jgi:hypothetical protein
MSQSVDQWTAQPRMIELGGRSLRVSPLTVEDLGAYQAWIYSQLPDAAAVARRFAEGLPPSVQAEMGREAIREDRAARLAHRIGMPAAGEMMQGLMGVVELLYLATRRHHPDLTRDDLPALILAGGAGAIDRVSAHAFGVDAGEEGEGGRPRAIEFEVLILNLARGYGYTPEQVGRMTLAQAQALNEALFPEAEKAKAAAVPEIRTPADLENLLAAARAGEFVL